MRTEAGDAALAPVRVFHLLLFRKEAIISNISERQRKNSMIRRKHVLAGAFSPGLKE